MLDFGSEVSDNIVFIIGWIKDVVVLLAKGIHKAMRKIFKKAQGSTGTDETGSG